MSNSPLVQYTRYSPNHSGKRTAKIKHIVPHHVAGIVSVETLGSIFAPASRQASSNYGIGSDGRIGLYVDEDNRAWTTSSNRIDQMSVTAELSNSAIGGDWLVSDVVINAAINLFSDICYRHGIYPCTYTGDEKGTLLMHKWYAQTNCPGNYLASKFPYIAQAVTLKLDALRKGGVRNDTPSSITNLNLKVGAKATIKADAKNYANTKNLVPIPKSLKGNPYTIMEISADKKKVLLQEIFSWIHVHDLVGYTPVGSETNVTTNNPTPSKLISKLIENKVEKVPVTVMKEVTKRPYIRLRKNTSLWDFDKSNWNDIKKVKDFPIGTELEVKAVVTNRLGGKYYVTPYSYDNEIMNGINFVDADLFYK